VNAITNHQVQDLNVRKKDTKQLELTEQGTKADESQRGDPDMGNDTKDTVEIRNPLRQSIESNQVSRESELKDVDEAQNLLQKVIGMLDLENDKSRAEQIYNFDQENLAGLLS
jgi:hypothetical protein